MESDEANDFAMMSEVIARRYCKERLDDERFGKRPDLIILDGGKPQLSAAIKQLMSLGRAIFLYAVLQNETKNSLCPGRKVVLWFCQEGAPVFIWLSRFETRLIALLLPSIVNYAEKA